MLARLLAPCARCSALRAGTSAPSLARVAPLSTAAPRVHMTEKCARTLAQVAAEGQVLRLTVDGGGCSGFEYKFTLESSPARGDDHLFTRCGATVLVDGLSMEFVDGATVDYCDELIRSGFKVTANPLAEQGCSCGASFAPRMD